MEKKYSERLLETLNKYHNRAIETAQVMEELIAMAQDFDGDYNRMKDMGLNEDEMAFYDALANDEESARELGNKTLRTIAVELTKQLREEVKPSRQAPMKNYLALAHNTGGTGHYGYVTILRR